MFHLTTPQNHLELDVSWFINAHHVAPFALHYIFDAYVDCHECQVVLICKYIMLTNTAQLCKVKSVCLMFAGELLSSCTSSTGHAIYSTLQLLKWLSTIKEGGLFSFLEVFTDLQDTTALWVKSEAESTVGVSSGEPVRYGDYWLPVKKAKCSSTCFGKQNNEWLLKVGFLLMKSAPCC